MSSQSSEIQEGFKITELGPLPEEWEALSIGDIALVASGGSAPQGDHYFGGNNPFIRVQHVEREIDRITKWHLINDKAVHDYGLSLFPKGTIVFPKSGASVYLEKRAVLPVDAYIVSHLCALSPKTDIVDGSFLFNVLRYIRFAELKAEGYPTLNLSEIKATKVPLPPLLEQKAIARVLSTIQKAIEARDKIIAAARELKKSFMRHLFTYGPVSIAEAEKVLLKETEIGSVPEHWQVVRLDTVADIIMGQSPPSSTYNTESIGLPFFQGKADFGDIYPTTRKWCSVPARIAEKYDILLSVRAPIGDVNIAKELCCIGRGLAAIRSNQKLEGKFLFYQLVNSKELLESKGSGTTFKEINKAAVTSFLIPLPPLAEQQEIARMLSCVDNKIEVEESRGASLQALFKTMLHHLMTGKVRVNDLEAIAA
jgi:type I restriction enzyme S subunit